MYTHFGYSQSRRDDLESLGYSLIYLMKDDLPWNRLDGENEISKNQITGEMKAELAEEDFCGGLPSLF